MATREMKRRSQNFKTEVIRKNLDKEFKKRQRKSRGPLSDEEQLDVLDSFRLKLARAGDRGRANAQFISKRALEGTPSLGRMFDDVLRLETVRPKIEARRRIQSQLGPDAMVRGPRPGEKELRGAPIGWTPPAGEKKIGASKPGDFGGPPSPWRGADLPREFKGPLYDDADLEAVTNRALKQEARYQGIDVGPLGQDVWDLGEHNLDFLRRSALQRQHQMLDRLGIPYDKPVMQPSKRTSKPSTAPDFGFRMASSVPMRGSNNKLNGGDKEFLEQQSRQRMLDDDLLSFMGRLKAFV